MKEIGLQPAAAGEPGGKETGQSVTHYIVAGGPYARAYAKLKARGFALHWQSAPEGKEAKAKKGRQDEIHLPGMRPERLGEARRAVDLRRVLRGRRERNLPDAGGAGRAEPEEPAEAA